MPRVDDTPPFIKPFIFHGVALEPANEKEHLGECPFCDDDKSKFYVETETGLWKCFVCGKSGNVVKFLQELWAFGTSDTREHETLANDRKLTPETLVAWGVVKSPTTGEWVIPGYNELGKVVQLYRYVKGARTLLLPTPGLEHALFSPSPFVAADKRKVTEVYLCEGPWDGMALWEALGYCKLRDGSDVVGTASVDNSLRASSAVLSVPGCTVFHERWRKLFSGRETYLLYDSDHPKKNNPEPSGLAGARRTASLLAKHVEPPSSIKYLYWGEMGYDPKLKSGYDIRDHLNNGVGKYKAVEDLLTRLVPIPDEWVKGRSKGSASSGSTELELLPCSDWKTLQNAWRKALRWNDGLDRALLAMLATVLSTETPGDQLWIKVTGPPSCGKSTLCEALSVARQYIYPKDTFTGLSSGYQVDQEGSENLSLTLKIAGKTLVINDGDTLLQLPNLPKVLSELRAFYGRNLRTSYKNKMSADHEGISTTIVLCGTESLRALDCSELGERMLDVVIMDKIDEEEESAIARRSGLRLMEMMRTMSESDDLKGDSPEMVEAKRLTGGFVCHLRRNCAELLSAVEADESKVVECEQYAAFVAYLRSRPSPRQKEKVQREMTTRLTNELVKLMMCSAAVLGKSKIDHTVMEVVRRATLDTSRGRTMEIVKHVAASDAKGGTTMDAICVMTGHDKQDEQNYVKHLRRIGAVQYVKGAVKNVRYIRLTPRMLQLYRVATTECIPF